VGTLIVRALYGRCSRSIGCKVSSKVAQGQLGALNLLNLSKARAIGRW